MPWLNFFLTLSFSTHSCNHQTENEFASNYIDKKFDFLYENFEKFDDLKIEQVRKFLIFLTHFDQSIFFIFSIRSSLYRHLRIR